MDFIKLPENSEKLLLDLIQTDNPVQMLGVRFEQASQREDDELRSMLRELHEGGYVNVHWADDVPYYLTLNNSARAYKKQLSEHETQKAVYSSQKKKVSPIIFISHRSTDKAIADMLLDFFSGTGIPRETVFCSSLPGNDINEKISGEVKAALKNSAVNIAILSNGYYQSAYCLNEGGILWYLDGIPVIPIGLPEIDSSNMYGFLSNEYKLRRLDSGTDISYIYDTIREAVSAPYIKAGVITYESEKLKKRYSDFLNTRECLKSKPKIFSLPLTSEITTDDERIVLYYILQKNIRRVSKSTVAEWLHRSEIYEVDVGNAFDLLSSFSDGLVKDETLEFGMDIFRKFSGNAREILDELKPYVEQHQKLASNTFMELWASGSVDSLITLFLAYIRDERVSLLGARWMEETQIKSIQQWEGKNSLDNTLSSNYGKSLQFLILNDLVYESDWTSFGNPREYALCASFQDMLFNHPGEIVIELEKAKDSHYVALPF